MNCLSISLLFASTTKGHFGRVEIFDLTLKDWSDNNYLELFQYKRANIKDGGESSAEEMKDKIKSYGFDDVIITKGNFKHFSPSHAIGQLQDVGVLIDEITTPFVFFLEDDFLLRTKSNNLEFHIQSAIDLLNRRDDIIQVRVPRFNSDFEHYKTLEKTENGWFRQNDIFSFNPYVARTSDVKILYNSIAAQSELIIDLISKGYLNAELTFTQLARQIRGEKCFWSWSAANLKCYHIGTEIGLEDKIEL